MREAEGLLGLAEPEPDRHEAFADAAVGVVGQGLGEDVRGGVEVAVFCCAISRRQLCFEIGVGHGLTRGRLGKGRGRAKKGRHRQDEAGHRHPDGAGCGHGVSFAGVDWAWGAGESGAFVMTKTSPRGRMFTQQCCFWPDR